MPPTFRPPGQRSERERKREHDVRRRVKQPWRRWFATPAWKAIRARQLADHPWCQRHAARGEIVPANEVHHVVPHRGDWELFIRGPFESLCKTCHSADAQREERASHPLLV